MRRGWTQYVMTGSDTIFEHSRRLSTCQGQTSSEGLKSVERRERIPFMGDLR